MSGINLKLILGEHLPVDNTVKDVTSYRELYHDSSNKAYESWDKKPGEQSADYYRMTDWWYMLFYGETLHVGARMPWDTTESAVKKESYRMAVMMEAKRTDKIAVRVDLKYIYVIWVCIIFNR